MFSKLSGSILVFTEVEQTQKDHNLSIQIG